MYVENYEAQMQEIDALRYTLDPSEFVIYDLGGKKLDVGLAQDQDDQEMPDLLESFKSPEDYRDEWIKYFDATERSDPNVEPPILTLNLMAIPQDFEINDKALIIFKDVNYCGSDE